jgi:hypothetical protein
MEREEKWERCRSAKRRDLEVPSNNLLGREISEWGMIPIQQCRVYSRWVEDCFDCSFGLFGLNADPDE